MLASHRQRRSIDRTVGQCQYRSPALRLLSWGTDGRPRCLGARPTTGYYYICTRYAAAKTSTPAALFASLQSPKFPVWVGARVLGPGEWGTIARTYPTAIRRSRCSFWMERCIGLLPTSFQGGKLHGPKPRSPMGKAWFGFQFCHSDLLERLLLGDIGWRGRIKAAGAFHGLPRELRIRRDLQQYIARKETEQLCKRCFWGTFSLWFPAGYVVVSAGPGYKVPPLGPFFIGEIFRSFFVFFSCGDFKSRANIIETASPCAVCAALGQAFTIAWPFLLARSGYCSSPEEYDSLQKAAPA